MKKYILSTLLLYTAFSTAIHTEHSYAAVKDNQTAINSLKTLPKSENARVSFNKYSVVQTSTDELGFTHYTLAPKVKGKLIDDSEIKVHVDPQGKVVLINGETDTNVQEPTNKIQISKDQAITYAFNAISIKQDQAKNFPGEVVKQINLNIDGDKNAYVYDVELITTFPSVSHWKIKINAQDGSIVSQQNLISAAATTGLGLGVNGSYKTLNINSGTTYTLEDLTHTGSLTTYQYNTTTGQGIIVSDSDKTFNATNQKAAVDAHYYANRVYNYYKNTFDRDSYDGKGTSIPSLVGVNTIFTTNDYRNNAAWLGDKMVYGDGDGSKFRVTSGALDVVAHEITHGVTQTTAALGNQGQTGALNESISDVFAYFIDPQDWLIAEDIYTPSITGDGLRSLSNPEAYGQPSNMSAYTSITADNGGVHTNMGIPNKAAYNTINALGIDKSQRIYYRALTQYFTSTSNFLDAKNALIQAARDLYGETAATSIKVAWDNVGVK